MKRRLSKGFTLIELMIVVAIIGILAAIAVPNFMKFQSRARQVEAKTNLNAWGTGAKAYFAEYNTYACGTCGWQVEKGNRYSYNVNGGGTLNGVSATIAADAAVVTAGACTAPASTAGTTTAQPTGTASGNIDADATCDQWTLDLATNLLSNTTNDVDVP